MYRSQELSPRSLGKHLHGGYNQSNSRDPAWKKPEEIPKNQPWKPNKDAAREQFKKDACAWKCWGWSQVCFAHVSNAFYLRIWLFQGTEEDNVYVGAYQNNWQLLQNNFVGVSIMDGLVWKAVQDIVYPYGNCSEEVGVVSTP